MQADSDKKTQTYPFAQAETSLGLKSEFFDAKFVYTQCQNSDPSAFLLALHEPLPSQNLGFTPKDIQLIHLLASNILNDAAKSLCVPVTTLAVAQGLFHFMFARKTYLDYDIRDIMISAMYVACKAEETLRKTYEISLVFDYIFKVYEGEKNIRASVLDSVQFKHIKTKTILKSQLDILFELGFEYYKLLNIPHRYIWNLLSLFDKHPEYSKICVNSFKVLNDIYSTTACLYYPHQILAASSVYIAMRDNSITFPNLPWWTLVEAYQEAIQNVQIMVKSIQKIKNEAKMSVISAKINEIGLKNQFTDAFPVPYYRKIMLQRRNKFRLKKQSEKKTTEVIQEKNDLNMPTIEEEKENQLKKQIQQKQQERQIRIQEQKKQKIIQKKDELKNISEKLKKYSITAAVQKPQNDKLSDSSSSQQNDQEMIAQLRKKILLKKQIQKGN